MEVPELVEHVDGLLAAKDDRRLKSLFARLSTQEMVHVINKLNNGKRKTFALLPPEVQAEVAPRLTELSKTFVLPRLSDHAMARFLHFCEEDDAADLLQFLSEERRAMILRHVKPEKRLKFEKLLTFHPETAGGLMDLNFIAVPEASTIKEVAEKVRAHMKEHHQTPLVVVLDKKGSAEGFIPYRSLMLAPPGTTMTSLMHDLPTIHHHTDQEKLVKRASRGKDDVFGITDDNDKLLGVVHLKDLLKVAQMEATEDVYKFAGVSPEEEMLGTAGAAIRMRYKWLLVNLGTAFLASSVVGLFEDTIEKLAILAVFMPIVAGMGGNAGTQALAVAVRGLALGEVPRKQRMRLVIKESITGLANGVINGIIVAGVVYVTRGRADIGLILAASMVINMVVAGIAGAVIPLTLKAFKVDPAVASAVFVTTVTDICGFLSFLGLATVLLV